MNPTLEKCLQFDHLRFDKHLPHSIQFEILRNKNLNNFFSQHIHQNWTIFHHQILKNREIDFKQRKKKQ